MSSIEKNIQDIPEADIQNALNAINGALTILKPYLVALTVEDRRFLPKVAEGTEPFLDKGAEYIESGVVTLPEMVSKPVLDTNYQVYKNLQPLENVLSNFCSMVSDTRMLAGSNAFTQVLGFYNYVKTAATLRMAGAKAIYEDMKVRFAKTKTKKPVDNGNAAGLEKVA